MSKLLKGFITYSHKNAAAKDELIERLAVMEQEDELTTWHDGEIAAGDEWYEDISKNLVEANILLYLVSSASLASKNCNKELAEALNTNIKVIPIILEHCDWMHHQLSGFEVLPLKGKPISKWEDPSEGWQNVVDGIRKAIHKMQSQSDSSSGTSREELRAELAFERGNIQLLLGQMDMAIEAYSEAIKLNPRHDSAYNNRGTAYSSKGEHDKAIEDYTKSIEIKPKGAVAYYNRGSVYDEKGEVDRAIEDYNKAIQLRPDFPQVYCNRGNIYYKKGEVDESINDYSAAIALDPKFAKAYNNRGTIYRTKGKVDRAMADYNKAIELSSNDAEVYYGRGGTYGKKGDFDLAIKDYSRALELKPKFAAAYNDRGTTYGMKGEYDLAIKDFNKALELKLDFSEVYNNRGYLILDENYG